MRFLFTSGFKDHISCDNFVTSESLAPSKREAHPPIVFTVGFATLTLSIDFKNVDALCNHSRVVIICPSVDVTQEGKLEISATNLSSAIVSLLVHPFLDNCPITFEEHMLFHDIES